MSSSAITQIGTPHLGDPRRPEWDRDTAMRLAATEYDRFVEHLRGLEADQWDARTCCPDWTVREMVCHAVGMAEFAASTGERMRQMRAAKKSGGLFVDALTALQVDKHRHQTPAELVTAMSDIGPRATRGRKRIPMPLRRLVKIEGHADAAGKETEHWTLGYLVDVILTRDTWMHRSDIATATGTRMWLTPDHDGVIVADVATEWAARHGQACRLILSGPAGGNWQFGSGGPDIALDAVRFCRIAAGREPGDGLLATLVPF